MIFYVCMYGDYDDDDDDDNDDDKSSSVIVWPKALVELSTNHPKVVASCVLNDFFVGSSLNQNFRFLQYHRNYFA